MQWSESETVSGNTDHRAHQLLSVVLLQLFVIRSWIMLMSADINVISDQELDRFAREEFKEDDDEINEALDTIVEWINSCPHLAGRQDRDFLR